jgi:hypothetical protein
MPDQAPAPARRRIALIAHDNKKRDMLEWAEYNLDLLHDHELFATATTGHLLTHCAQDTGSCSSQHLPTTRHCTDVIKDHPCIRRSVRAVG